jgi:hypothetical protein
MAQLIKQGNIFGRVGTGIGKGLAEQVPKEIERNRLSAGLQQLERDAPGLSPQQYYTRALQVPHLIEHPQATASLAELARHQNVRDNLRRNRMEEGYTPSASPNLPTANNRIQEAQFGTPQMQQRAMQEGGQLSSRDKIPSNYTNREEQALDKLGNLENPTDKKFEPARPWTPERRQDEILNQLDLDPTASIAEANQRASQIEARELSMPEAEKAIYRSRQETQRSLDAEMDRQLETILQKEGKGVYGDLTGESILGLKKAAFNDLVTNPKLNERSAAEKWIKKGKDLAETKNEIKSLSHRDIFDKLLPFKKDEAIDRLMSASKIFAETGNSNELFNILRSKNQPEQRDTNGNIILPSKFGFDLTPGRAALIAYPRSPHVKELINKNKENVSWMNNRQRNSQKFAADFMENFRPEDSVLAVAREMKDRNGYFDQYSFFEYLRNNQEKLPPNMQKELVIGPGDFTSNWGDLALFPLLEKRSKAHE